MSPKALKFVQIFLFVLILIGVGLLTTQKYWLPSLVRYILSNDNAVVVPLEESKWIGTISEVDTGCFFDAVCSVTIGNKKVIIVEGGRGGGPSDIYGEIVGVDSIGDFQNYIGKKAKVYAGKNSNGDYTLYGNTEFYIELVK